MKRGNTTQHTWFMTGIASCLAVSYILRVKHKPGVTLFEGQHLQTSAEVQVIRPKKARPYAEKGHPVSQLCEQVFSCTLWGASQPPSSLNRKSSSAQLGVTRSCQGKIQICPYPVLQNEPLTRTDQSLILTSRHSKSAEIAR